MAVNRSREAWKTYGNVFDNFTIRNLEKLATQGHFEELVNSVALGKEANVFRGVKTDGSSVAVKIYRLENCNFNKMYSYIAQDPRYIDLKGDRRRIIFAWTQREYRNLMKAREVIRVPTPIEFKDSILITEFIGDEHEAAPMLKDAHIDDAQATFDAIIEMITKLYKKANLVHGDLSAFNILLYNDQPVFIDFSQSSTVDSPMAREMLERDLANICTFFKKHGISGDAQAIFDQITKKEAV